MAEKTPVRTQNSRLGGFSQDEFIGPDNSYDYSRNMDIRTDIKGLALSSGISLYNDYTSQVVTMMKDGADNLRVYLKNGDLYKNTTYIGFLDNNISKATLNEFYDATLGQNLLVLCNDKGKIYRINIATNAITLVTTFAFSNTLCTLVYNGVFLVGSGRHIDQFLATIQSGTFTPNKLVFETNSSVEFMSKYIDQIKIYNFVGTNAEGSTIQYIWNGVDANVSYFQGFPNIRPRCGYAEGPVDRILGGTSSAQSILLNYQGPNYTELFRNLRQGDKFNLNSENDQMSVKEKVLYIGGTTNSGNQGIFTCGKYLPQYPRAVNFEYEIPTTDFITAIEFNGGNLYIGTSSGKVYRGLSIGYNNNTFQTSSELVSRKYIGPGIVYKKKIEKITLGCSIPANTSIKLSYQLDDGGRQSIATLTSADMEGKRVRLFGIPIGNIQEYCNWMQYKVEFTGNGSVTPYLYEINTFYSIIQE